MKFFVHVSLSLVLPVIIIMSGCASYKQLKPEPLISFAENGYHEIKNKKKNFEIKAGGMYFISFPAPSEDNFYLVIRSPQVSKFNNFLTKTLVKNKTYGDKIKNVSEDKSLMSVFPINASSTPYFWLIDNVPEDIVVTMDYRYVPQWRFKFENKHSEYKDTYSKNIVSRDNYKNLGTSFSFDNFNFDAAVSEVTRKKVELKKVYDELLAIEAIFPKSIVGSTDKAYVDYMALKGKLEDEMAFQESYLATLKFAKNEYITRGDPMAFVKKVDNMIIFFKEKNRQASNVVDYCRKITDKRLLEIVPFYEQRLGGKTDDTPINPELYLIDSFNKLANLYSEASIPQDAGYTALAKFVNDFNTKSKALTDIKMKKAELEKGVDDLKTMPDNQFFSTIAEAVSKLKASIPTPIDQSYAKYAGYRCSQSLNDDITQSTIEINNALEAYTRAANLVSTLNSLKATRSYGQMISMLKSNPDLRFLLEKYKELDKMFVTEKSRDISGALAEYSFFEAEKNLNELYRTNNFLDPGKIVALKNAKVRALEDSLYFGVERLTRSRVNKFLQDNVDTLENIDSLYEDSVFYPVYNITFSTGSNRELLQRKEDLVNDLVRMKETEFPQKAVKILYEEFVKNPDAKGVAMARAIVSHGNHYKGNDKKTKRMIAECSPFLAKWIVKTKRYRRVFALPLTDNKNGSNRYFLRLNLRIKSDAKFPVYDLYIKLPKRIVRNAGSKQWYEKIMLNKKLLKNEGRFKITAPTAENGYVCQVGPVRMRKDKNNYLDIYFKDRSYKVYSVSVMAQKPIIKKN